MDGVTFYPLSLIPGCLKSIAGLKLIFCPYASPGQCVLMSAPRCSGG